MRITKDAKKFIAKILVAVLIISMMPSFGVEVKAAPAMQLDSEGVAILSDTTISFGKVGDIDYVEIIASGYRYGTSAENITGSYDYTFPANASISVGSGLTLAVKSSASFVTATVNSNAELDIENSSAAVTAVLTNYGTVKLSNNSNIYSFLNSGFVYIDNLTATADTVQTTSGASWIVSGSCSLSNLGGNSIRSIEATDPDVTIYSDGSTTFNLSVQIDDTTNLTKEISGAVASGTTAGSLIREGALGDAAGIDITITGVNIVDGYYYAKDSITITPTSSFRYTVYDDGYPNGSWYGGHSGYEEEFWGWNSDTQVVFENNLGLRSDPVTLTDHLSPADIIDVGIIFDDVDPVVQSVTKNKTAPETVSFVEGMTISANDVTFTIKDHYLYSVSVSDGRTFTRESTTYPVTSMGGDFWQSQITFNADPTAAKTYTMTATDCSGNEKTFSFTLKGEYLSSDGLKCTLSGLVNEKYTKDKVTVKAPDGYEIMPSYGTGDKFVESFDYKRSDLYGSDGKFKTDLTFTFKRKSDGAVTKPVAWDKCCDFLDDVVFDEIDPVISTVTADNKTITFKTGDVIEAASVTFTVTDVNLEKIVVDKTVTDRTNGVKKDGNLYKGTVTFTVAEGESKSYKFTAYDMSGRAVEYTFTLKYPRQVPDLTVTLADQFAGVSYTPAITTVSDGAKDVKYYYAENLKASVSANEFSETVPTMPGKYVVKAVIPETNKYLSATAYAVFSIAYLPTPENPYTLDGDMGENGYYKTDVLITPPAGYTICATLTGKYTDTLVYSAALTNIYLKQTSTGALTGPIAFNETLKVDKTAPAISTAAKNQAGNVVDLSKLIYADKVTFTISDEHLSKVTINGQEVSFTDGKVTISLVCNGHKYYNIVAVDEAGNEYSFRVEMKATWLQSGIVPVGTLISLVPGEGVALEPGEFIIEDSDDTTVYNGGMEVYVSEETELTLIKVN